MDENIFNAGRGAVAAIRFPNHDPVLLLPPDVLTCFVAGTLPSRTACSLSHTWLREGAAAAMRATQGCSCRHPSRPARNKNPPRSGHLWWVDPEPSMTRVCT